VCVPSAVASFAGCTPIAAKDLTALGHLTHTTAPLDAIGKSGTERLARFFSDVVRLESEQLFALSQANSSYSREAVAVEFA